jgi:hypothetical protein
VRGLAKHNHPVQGGCELCTGRDVALVVAQDHDCDMELAGYHAAGAKGHGGRRYPMLIRQHGQRGGLSDPTGWLREKGHERTAVIDGYPQTCPRRHLQRHMAGLGAQPRALLWAVSVLGYGNEGHRRAPRINGVLKVASLGHVGSVGCTHMAWFLSSRLGLVHWIFCPVYTAIWIYLDARRTKCLSCEICT